MSSSALRTRETDGNSRRLPPDRALQLTSALQASRGNTAQSSLRSQAGSCHLAAGPVGYGLRSAALRAERRSVGRRREYGGVSE